MTKSETFLRLMETRIENLGAPLEQVPREMTVPHRPEAKQIIEELAQTVGVDPQELFNRKKEKQAYHLLAFPKFKGLSTHCCPCRLDCSLCANASHSF